MRTVTILAVVLSCSNAHAFSVASGFGEGCHEMITSRAFQDFLLDLPLTDLVPPESEAWRDMSVFILAQMGLDASEVSDAHRAFITSLVVGVRSPDTDGHSITNIETVRQLHADPDDEGQYAHALRAIGDDEEAGNAAAVDGIRRQIAAEIRLSSELAARPQSEQFIKAPMFFDYYGRFEVDVWGPAYHLGRAAHALQDSFSHTIRNEAKGFATITTVFNYVEAISTDFSRGRDGLPHSDSMDDCTRTTELADAATIATIDLFLAVREIASGRDPNALELVLDRWVTYEEGCTAENGYCGNERWAEIAAEAETGPYLETMLGCAAAPATRSTGPAALLLLLLVWPRRRAPA